MVPSNSAEGLAPSYVVDAAMSRFSVKAYSSGVLSAFGHNPTIAIRSFSGEAWYRAQAPERSSLQIVIDASSLAVTSDCNDKDRSEIERMMREEVLQTAQFPDIRFASSDAEASQIGEGMLAMRIIGKLSLHGVERDLMVPCNVIVDEDRLRANGDFSIRQTDYKIRLVTVAGGTLKLKDELKFTFDIVAARQRDAHQ